MQVLLVPLELEEPQALLAQLGFEDLLVLPERPDFKDPEVHLDRQEEYLLEDLPDLQATQVCTVKAFLVTFTIDPLWIVTVDCRTNDVRQP